MTPCLIGLQTIILIITSAAGTRTDNRLLVVVLDGFRWDYVVKHENRMPGFHRLKQLGGHAKRVKPVFPTDCYPNIYSIFTGVFPAYHGVVANRVYDFQTKQEFNHMDNTIRHNQHLWVDTEPIWVSAKKQKKRVSLYHLPTCVNNDGPHEPDHCLPYSSVGMQQLRSTMKSALNSLWRGSSDMSVVYNDRLDAFAHDFGPDSDTLDTEILPQLDADISYIVDQIDSNKEVPVNLLIVSDHGMTQIAENKQIYLDRWIPRSYIEKIINTGVTVSIWPKRGKEFKVYNRLRSLASAGDTRNCKVYRKNEIPKQWQAKKHSRMPPILIVANNGFFISSRKRPFPRDDLNNLATGWHGYSPETEDMQSALFFYGPKASPNVMVKSIEVVDIYELMCHVIGISPLLNNGSKVRIAPLIDRNSRPQSTRLSVQTSATKSDDSDVPIVGDLKLRIYGDPIDRLVTSKRKKQLDSLVYSSALPFSVVIAVCGVSALAMLVALFVIVWKKTASRVGGSVVYTTMVNS